MNSKCGKGILLHRALAHVILTFSNSLSHLAQADHDDVGGARVDRLQLRGRCRKHGPEAQILFLERHCATGSSTVGLVSRVFLRLYRKSARDRSHHDLLLTPQLSTRSHCFMIPSLTSLPPFVSIDHLTEAKRYTANRQQPHPCDTAGAQFWACPCTATAAEVKLPMMSHADITVTATSTPGRQNNSAAKITRRHQR